MNEIAIRAGRPFSFPGREARAASATLGLVVLTDLLFWDVGPAGLSLFLFFTGIACAILLARGAKPLTMPVTTGLGLALLGAMPLLEAPGFWGFCSATFGASMLALAAVNRWPRSLVDLPAVLLRFGVVAPFRLAADAGATLMHGAERGFGKSVVRAVLMWVVPLILALVFTALFAAANPLIESALQAINPDAVLSLLDPGRVIVWGAAAVFVWPLLMPKLLRRRRAATVQGPQLPAREGVVFGPGAILRSLVLFNALFALQTGLDVAYLWGGVALPDGMTYASYAHRGAYPLIVTALLAAAFVLAAMRPNGAAERSPLIRGLVYVFIAQNVLLVISSLLRLDLYVEVYTLTELRIAAGIWMGLVAVGLLLILARIALGKSNKWLIATNLASLGLTLYASAYVDFSALIARFNVEHSFELTGSGSTLDIGYLRNDLGPGAIPAMDLFLDLAATKGMSDAETRDVRMARDELAVAFTSRPNDWRLWSFRDQRLADYLAGHGSFDELAQTARTLGNDLPGDADRPDTATMP